MFLYFLHKWKTSAYLSKVSLTSGCDLHTVHEYFLPLPAKLDTVSHPVKANQKRNPLQTDSPRLVTYSWIGSQRSCLPTPNSTHSSSICKDWNKEIASTTTSVSTVFTTILRWPESAACFTWTNAPWRDWGQVPRSKNSIWGQIFKGVSFSFYSACQTTYLYQISWLYRHLQ